MAHRRALKIALLYFSITAVWILASDWVLSLLKKALSPEAFLVLGICKGWIYGAASSVILYIVLKRQFTSFLNARAQLTQLNQTLETIVAQRTEELIDLYNNAPCGYHSIDSNGIVRKINDTELQWLGYSREEVVDKKQLIDLMHPADREKFLKNFEVVKESGELHDIEVGFLRKDGSILRALVNVSSIRDIHGNFMLTRMH